MAGMVQCAANYVPLSPISFLERAAFVYHERVSIVYGSERYTWRETHQRCCKLASALSQQLGIRHGDMVAALAPNLPALYELHFGVPMAGAVLSSLNTKLDATTLASMLKQLQAKAIFVDSEALIVVLEAFELLILARKKPPQLVLITEHIDQSKSNLFSVKKSPSETLDYNELLSMGKSEFEIVYPKDECDPISVNYTSGSTGKPKGVVYSHRAVYLNSLAQIFRADPRKMPVFLWTVDMFRCNGWCFIWALAAVGGTNICLRNASAKAIFDSISLHKVTLLCGSPTILTKIADAPPSERQPLPRTVDIIVAGALQPPRVLTEVQKMGFRVSHAYGMTEALGIVTFRECEPETSMANSPSDEEYAATAKFREGIHNVMVDAVDVKDPATMTSVPADRKTIGEVMLRGNNMMSGYLGNPEKALRAFKGGWYRTGDLGVRHEDGYIEMKDRAVDIVVCGREKVSTLEVEAVVLSHPKVLEAAVVGKPHDVLGKTVCAFVKLRNGCFEVTAEEIIKLCADQLPQYMVPQTVIFVGDLPVSSTGKIQKSVLREKVAMGSLDHSNSH